LAWLLRLPRVLIASRLSAQVNMMLWPRFRVAFDAQLASLRAVSEREVMSADLQAHYITRRYADFAATAHLLAPVNGDGQLDQSLVRCSRCLRSHGALALTRRVQAVRNEDDLACMSVPDKYKVMGTFYKARAAQAAASPDLAR
jgi:hypothetical protein